MDPAPLNSLQDNAQREAFLMLKKQSCHELSTADNDELGQIAARRQAVYHDRLRSLEAPFAHLPPLPPALVEYEDTTFGPLEMTFFVWCIEGKKEAVEGYIEAQEDQASDALLQRGLASACESGQAQVARYLMQKGARVHDVAVKHACSRCDLALFEAFIEHGWHPNQQIPSFQGHFGVALLHCTHDLQVVEFLLSHGADPNLGPFDRSIRGSFGSTSPMNRQSGAALEAAAVCGNIEVIDLLLQHGAVLKWSKPLHAAISTGETWDRNRPAFLHLLQLGADPNRNTDIKYGTLWDVGTPLIWAVRAGNWDAVELLLEAGAYPDLGNFFTCHAGKDDRQKQVLVINEKVKEKKNSA
ncbi:ankyrin repeat-containing domain protein [Nemania sp. NC0429]|nr:ankyrin repeat-containing domain protein [Nemania sp. NC0429]